MKALIVIPTLDIPTARKTGMDAIAVCGVDDVELCIVYDKDGIGATKNLNAGFKEGIKLGAEYIGYINDDSSQYQQDWLKRLIEVLEEDPKHMLASPGGPCRAPPQKFCKPGLPKGIEVVNRLSWFCVLMKREIFEEIGYLDEQFSHYASDGDFCFRIRDAGYNNVYVQDVYVHHDVTKPKFPWWREDSQKLRAKWNMKKGVREMVKLNIGCAGKRMDGYVGVDIRKTKASSVVAPSWNLPYDAGIVDEIFTSHMMEHLKEEEIEDTLEEFSRVLKKGGKLIIRVPDFEVYATLFLERGWDWKSTWGSRYIFGYQRRKADYHFSGWWKERFERTLPQYGFEIVKIENIDTRQPENHPQYVAGGDILCEAKLV